MRYSFYFSYCVITVDNKGGFLLTVEPVLDFILCEPADSVLLVSHGNKSAKTVKHQKTFKVLLTFQKSVTLKCSATESLCFREGLSAAKF